MYYALAWLPVAGIAVAAAMLSPRAAPNAIERALSSILIAALLGAPVWPLTARLEASTRTAAIAAYVVAGFVFAAALSVAAGLVARLQGDTMTAAPYGNASTIVAGLFLYLVIAIGMRAVRNAKRLEMSRQAIADANQARAAAEALRVRAELQALRAHLDPHFLFNTLNAIAAVVETNPAQARDMLVRAGALLRRVLDLSASDRDVATVADEWAMVSEYLAFEEIRMGDRLRVEAVLSEAALDCEIPAFMLQPLVENAIRHGLFPRPGGGLLRISGSVEGGMLHLEVADNGAGADLDVVNRATGGFGLRATRQRVRGAYPGSSARVEVETAPGRGFRVRLVLPADLPASLAGAVTDG